MAVPLPQVVLFGDSLFQGSADIQDGFSFQAALQNLCIRRFDVVNRGLSGYNTSQALKALPQIFVPPVEGGPRIAYIFVLFGANDASVVLPTNNQHVPIDKFKKNLSRIITHPNIAAHKPKIFLVTPPPLDEIRMTEVNLAEGHPASTRQTKISASYAEAVREVAAAHPDTVTLVDLWQALMGTAIASTPDFEPAQCGPTLGDPACGKRGYLEHLLSDGLHLTGTSYRIFFGLIKAHVGSEWANLEFVLPEWRKAPWLNDQE